MVELVLWEAEGKLYGTVEATMAPLVYHVTAETRRAVGPGALRIGDAPLVPTAGGELTIVHTRVFERMDDWNPK